MNSKIKIMNKSDKLLSISKLKTQKSNSVNRKSLNEIKIGAKSSNLYKSPLINDQIGRASTSIQKSLSSKNFHNNQKSKKNFIQKNKSLTKFKKSANPIKQTFAQNPITFKQDDQVKTSKIGKKYNLTRKIVKSKPYSFLKQVYSRLKFKKLNKTFKILAKNKARTITNSENTESLIEGFKSINSDSVVSFKELILTKSNQSIESIQLNYSKENDLEKWEILTEFKIKKPNLSSVSLNTIEPGSIIDQVNVEYVKIDINEIYYITSDAYFKRSSMEFECFLLLTI